MKQLKILSLLSLFFLGVVNGSRAEKAATPAKPASPARAAYEVLERSLSADGVDILDTRGYLIVLGASAKERRVAYVQWDALRNLVENAGALEAFFKAFDANRKEPSAAGDLPALRPLQALAAGGLLTPGVRGAVNVLTSHLEDIRSLSPAAQATTLPRLFETSWGARFIARTRAELPLDIKSLAQIYFDRHLSDPEDMEASADHLYLYMKEVHGEDLTSLLEKDLTARTLSIELSGWIAKYLLEQKRLRNVHRTPARLAALERRTGLKADLRDLRNLVPRLRAAEGLLKDLRGALSGPSPEASFNFEGTQLHVHAVEQWNIIDTGDEVGISLAFWVNGLGHGGKAEVSAVGFVDSGAGGIRDRVIRTAERTASGPHTFSTSLTPDSHKPILYRFFLSAPGAEPFERELEIPIAARWSAAAAAAAEAENRISGCDFKKALEALKNLEENLKPLAAKPQFERLLADIRSRQDAAERYQEIFSKLETSLPGARLFASKQHCRYRTDRALRSLSLLNRLPPGCDLKKNGSSLPLAEELSDLYLKADTRRQNQLAFRRAVSKARDLEKECRGAQAAKTYAAALALLDSDPAARCGAWGREHTAVRIDDLARARRFLSTGGGIGKAIGKAEGRIAKGDHAGALKILNPLVEGIREMKTGGCYADRLKRARRLALEAGIAQGPAARKRLKAALGDDDTAQLRRKIAKQARRIRRERRSQLEREWRRQSPGAPGKTDGGR